MVFRIIFWLLLYFVSLLIVFGGLILLVLAGTIDIASAIAFAFASIVVVEITLTDVIGPQIEPWLDKITQEPLDDLSTVE